MSLANLANNVSGLTLAAAYTAGTSSTFTLASGASNCPSTPFRITVATAASYNTTGEVHAIYEVSSVAGQVLTVGTSAAIEGTTDRNFAIGDYVDLRITAGTIGDLNTLAAPLGTAQTAGQFLGGPTASPSATPTFRAIATTDLPAVVLGTHSINATVNTNGVNNWAPTGIATANRVRVTAQATGTAGSQMPNITGISNSSIADGQVLVIENVGTMTLRLDANTGSSAGNQFLFNETYLYIQPNQSVTLQYDSTSSGWLRTDRAVNTGCNYFGTGTDGNVSVTGSGLTLTRDMYYQNLTLPNTSGAVLNPSQCRIYVSEVLDLSACVANAISKAGNVGSNASSATGASGGSTPGANHYGAGVAGSSGANGTTSSGANPSPGGLDVNCVNTNANATSGSGGNGGSTAGGTGQAPSGALANPWQKYQENLLTGTSFLSGGGGGCGGASGGGESSSSSNGGGGGGGGAGGNIVWIAARTIYRGASTATPAIQFKGGAGGNGAAGQGTGNSGGGGGGSGGAGGWVWIAFEYLAGSQVSGAIDVSGGAGGSGGALHGTGTAGAGGNQGNGGTVTLLNMLAGTTTQTVGASGGAASGATGGSGVSTTVSL